MALSAVYYNAELPGYFGHSSFGVELAAVNSQLEPVVVNSQLESVVAQLEPVAVNSHNKAYIVVAVETHSHNTALEQPAEANSHTVVARVLAATHLSQSLKESTSLPNQGAHYPLLL